MKHIISLIFLIAPSLGLMAQSIGTGPPVASDDTAVIVEDSAVLLDVLTNDFDPDGDAISIQAISDPQNGEAVQMGDYIHYQPHRDWNGIDTFQYRITDGVNVSNIATVTITVTADNDPFEDVKLTLDEDTLGTLFLPFGVYFIDQPAHGWVDYFPGSTFSFVTYYPWANYNGPDSFTVYAWDIREVEVYITVIPVNDPPNVVPDTAATDEDTSVVIDALTNDWDVDGDVLSIDSIGQPSNGITTIVNGGVEYTPNLNWFGEDSFLYFVTDGTEKIPGLVTVTVNPIDDCIEIVLDGPLELNHIGDTTFFPWSDVFIDVDGSDGFSISSRWESGGFPNIVAGGFEWIGGPGSWSFDILDGACDVYISIVFVRANEVPEADDITLSLDEDFLVITNLANYVSDADGDIQTFTASNSNHGTVNLISTGIATYIPDSNYHGTDSFTYTTNDGYGASATATVYLTINSINDAPIAISDEALSLYATPIDVNVLANDTDIDNALDPASVTIITPPQTGTAFVNTDGSIHVEPYQGYTGDMYLTYIMADLEGAQSNEAVLHIGVGPRAPQAITDALNTMADTASSLMLTANDIDPDGDLDVTSVVLMQMPSHGSLVNNGDGSVTYAPDAGYHGSDVFSYHVSDMTGLQSNNATVQVDVSGSNNTIPTAVYDSQIITLGSSLVFDVLANDWDADGDALDADSVVIEGNPAKGTVVVVGGGFVEYLPNSGVVGTTDTFTYSMMDMLGGRSNIATVQIEIPQDDAPNSNVPAFSLKVGYMAAGQSSTILLNDASANSSIDLIWSNAAGSIDTRYGNVGLSSDYRILGGTAASSSGAASFTFVVPSSALGMTLYFQALDRGARRLSDVRSAVVY
jgi:large repetitive protein